MTEHILAEPSETEKPNNDGPGVPEAIPRTLRKFGERLGAEALDCLWIFPPMVRGRKEWGLVAASCFEEDGGRRLVTARYSAERTGKGLSVESELCEEGSAPADRMPRIMEGVVRRGPRPLGSPRVVELGGALPAFEELMSAYEPALFEEDLLQIRSKK